MRLRKQQVSSTGAEFDEVLRLRFNDLKGDHRSFLSGMRTSKEYNGVIQAISHTWDLGPRVPAVLSCRK
jgi:hypothetical protein